MDAGLAKILLRSDAASQEVMTGKTSGEVRPTSSGSDAASQEASQVNRHRSTVLRPEQKAWPRVWRERDPVQEHYGMTMSDDYEILL